MATTIKATLLQISAAVNSGGLKKLVNAALPAKTAYWLGRTAEAAEVEYTRTQGLRDDLIRKLGRQEGEGEEAKWLVDGEALGAFEEEFNSLLKEEVEIVGRKIGLDELVKVELTGLEMLALGFLIEEEGEQEKAASVGGAA